MQYTFIGWTRLANPPHNSSYYMLLQLLYVLDWQSACKVLADPYTRFYILGSALFVDKATDGAVRLRKFI